MTIELLGSLALFVLVTSITPGPNTLMLMTSGANFGFRRTVPHMMGVTIGFTVMLVLVGLGMMRVFDALPGSQTALKTISVAYLLWLAWKIANAAPLDEGAATGKPFTFWQAALFQWVNPKAWAIGVSAMSIYAASHSLGGVAIVAAAFGLVALPSNSVWMMLGQKLRRWLTNKKRLRLFNIGMAVMLVASVLPVL